MLELLLDFANTAHSKTLLLTKTSSVQGLVIIKYNVFLPVLFLTVFYDFNVIFAEASNQRVRFSATIILKGNFHVQSKK